jgi:hypothetical protein
MEVVTSRLSEGSAAVEVLKRCESCAQVQVAGGSSHV